MPPAAAATTTLYDRATPTRAGYRELDARALASPGAARIVDVREAHELAGELGHIPGVEHVPLAALPRRAAAWPRDAELVLVCRSGGRSARAAEVLVAAGFRRVVNLAGGMLAYHAAGLPVART